LTVSADAGQRRRQADRDDVTSLDDFRFRSAVTPIYNERVVNGRLCSHDIQSVDKSAYQLDLQENIDGSQ